MPHANFSFLAKEFSLRHNRATAAEYYLYAEPGAALMKPRQFGEKLIAYVYDTHQLKQGEETSFHNKICILEDERIYSNNIASRAHHVKHSGGEPTDNQNDNQMKPFRHTRGKLAIAA